MGQRKDAKLGIRLPEELKIEIQRYALARDRSGSSVVRVAVREFLCQQAQRNLRGEAGKHGK